MLNNPEPLESQGPAVSPIPYHPCLNDEAHSRVARLHLPIAPRCNLACAFCERIVSTNPDLPGPGTTARVISVAEAEEKAHRFLEEYGADSIVGVAGPGDPLANEETFALLERLKDSRPEARTCLCTNGLVLPQSADRLIDLGVRTLTVTVNGVTPATVAAMQPRVMDEDEWVHGQEGAELLMARQLEGIARVVAGGIVVKVNMVVTPEVNMQEAGEVASRTAGLGARVFNPMPLIPRHALAHCRRPTKAEMASLRMECGQEMYVFTKCKQCRADAVGIPGKEGKECRTSVRN